MVGEEVEPRGKHTVIIQPRSQSVGIESGEREITLCTILILHDPADRRERECPGACGGLRGSGSASGVWKVGDCDGLSASVVCHRNKNGTREVAKRIMVVEDNDLNRKLFCDVLKANGFDVDPVADGDKVLASAKDHAPDLIIMDIQLPGISGVDLIAAAKQDRALKDIPVLAVTAFAGKGDEERIRGAGAAGYLAKPVSIMPFMNAVKELLPQEQHGSQPD